MLTDTHDLDTWFALDALDIYHTLFLPLFKNSTTKQQLNKFIFIILLFIFDQFLEREREKSENNKQNIDWIVFIATI